MTNDTEDEKKAGGRHQANGSKPPATTSRTAKDEGCIYVYNRVRLLLFF